MCESNVERLPSRFRGRSPAMGWKRSAVSERDPGGSDCVSTVILEDGEGAGGRGHQHHVRLQQSRTRNPQAFGILFVALFFVFEIFHNLKEQNSQ